MRPSALPVLGLASLLALCSGCSVHEHTVGTGPAGIGVRSDRQIYFLFGLFRLNDVDAEAMADDSTSYRIRTAVEFSDLLLSIVLAPITVSTRSVEVTR